MGMLKGLTSGLNARRIGANYSFYAGNRTIRSLSPAPTEMRGARQDVPAAMERFLWLEEEPRYPLEYLLVPLFSSNPLREVEVE